MKDLILQALIDGDIPKLESLLNPPTHFDLSGLPLTLPQIKLLAAFLMTKKTLTSIDLSNSNISDEGLEILKQAIFSNTNLTDVNLSDNPISDAYKAVLDVENKGSANKNPINILLNDREKALKRLDREKNREKNQKLPKFKVVILIGKDLTSYEQEIIKNAPKDGSVKIVSNAIEDDSYLSEIDGRTDENTIFITFAHGANKDNIHILGNDTKDIKPTDKFFNNLKNFLKHDIKATLFSCQAGGVLKMGKIEEGIALLASSSSKHVTLSYQNTEAILEILRLVKENPDISYEEICRGLIVRSTGTSYSHSGKKGEAVVKHPRIGTFYLTKIEKLMKGLFTQEQQDAILKSLSKEQSGTKKISFSINAIERKLKDPNLKIDQKSIAVFIKILEDELDEKTSAAGMESFAQDRDAKFSTNNSVLETKTSDIKSQMSPHETLMMAITIKDINLVRSIISQHPTIIDEQFGMRKDFAIRIAAEIGSSNIVEFLLGKGARLDLKDIDGDSAFKFAKSAIAKRLKDVEAIHNQILKDLQKPDFNFKAKGNNMTLNFISRNLKDNKVVTNLDLSFNNITSEIAENLGRSLADNETLTSINLSSSKIDLKGLKALAAGLKKNKHITNIDLSNNNIDSEGLKILIELLKENKTITHINLSYNKIEDEGALLLAEALNYSPDSKDSKSATISEKINLTNVNLAHNPISDVGETALFSAAASNQNPIIINLTFREKSLQKKLNRDKNKQLPQYRAVILLGKNLSEYEKEIIAAAAKDESIKIISNAFEDDSYLSEIDGRVNENTAIVAFGQGMNKDGLHYIDDKPTDKFLNDLRASLELPTMNVTLFSSHGGAALKNGKIDSGITVLARSGSKHNSLRSQDVESILEMLRLIKAEPNISNEDIQIRLVKRDMETFYFHSGDGDGKTMKIHRIGKFNLEDIRSLAINETVRDQLLLGIKKTSFSIKYIEKKLDEIDQKEGNIMRLIDSNWYGNSLKALQDMLAVKLSPDAIKTFAQNRNIDGLEAKTPPLELDPSAILLMALHRSDIELAFATISNNPHIANKPYPKDKNKTPLMFALALGSLKVITALLEQGASLDGKDDSGRTVFDYVTDKNLHKLFTELQPIMRDLKTKEILDLSNNKVSDNKLPIIAKILQQNKVLNSINFSNNNIHFSLAEIIVRILKETPTLINVNLSNDSFNDSATIKLIVEGLKANKNLSNINCAGIRVNSKSLNLDDLKLFSDLLKDNKSLIHFDFSRNNIGPKGMELLAASLKTNNSIKSLNLSGNNLGSEGLRIIIELLKANPNITHIDLSNNNLGSDDMKAFCQFLKTNKTVTSINFNGNNIGDKGAKELATIIKENKTNLSEIKISDNKIGHEGAKSIVKAVTQSLKNNKTLVNIECGFDNINPKYIVNFAKALEKNTTLAKVDFGKITLDSKNKVETALFKALMPNKTLTHFGKDQDLPESIKGVLNRNRGLEAKEDSKSGNQPNSMMMPQNPPSSLENKHTLVK